MMRNGLLIATALLFGLFLFGCVQPQQPGPQQMKDSVLYSLVNTGDAGGVIYGEAYEDGIKELQSLSPLAIPANLNLIKSVKFAVIMPTFPTSAPISEAGTVPSVTTMPIMISSAETPLGAKEFMLLTQAFGGLTGMGGLQNGSVNLVEKAVLGRTIQVLDTGSIGGPGMPGMDVVCVWKEGNELVSVTTLNCTGYIEKNLGKGSKDDFTNYLKDGLALKDKLDAKGKLFGIGAITMKGAQAGEGGANAFGDANADYLQMVIKSRGIAQQPFYCSGSRETRGGRDYCVDKPSGAPVKLLTITTKFGDYGLIMLVAVKGDESAAKETALAALDAAKLEGEPAKIGVSTPIPQALSDEERKGRLLEELKKPGCPTPSEELINKALYCWRTARYYEASRDSSGCVTSITCSNESAQLPKPPEDIGEKELEQMVDNVPDEPIDADIAKEVQ